MKIKVYGWEIPILKQKGLTAETGYLGYYCPIKKHIVMDAHPTSKDEYIATLVHEIVHAIFHRAGLHQTKMPVSIEEIICEQVSTVISENFKLTPKRKS